jgi:hypothetical protein
MVAICKMRVGVAISAAHEAPSRGFAVANSVHEMLGPWPASAILPAAGLRYVRTGAGVCLCPPVFAVTAASAAEFGGLRL